MRPGLGPTPTSPSTSSALSLLVTRIPVTSPTTPRLSAARSPFTTAKRLMPADGSIAGFVAAVAAQRARRIEVVAVELGSRSASGLRVVGSDVDYLVHATSANAEERDLSICRELAHLLLGHHHGPVLAEPLAVGPTRSLRAHPYGQRQEARAERLARRMLALSAARQHSSGRTGSARFRLPRSTHA